jgi:hypothetical protein
MSRDFIPGKKQPTRLALRYATGNPNQRPAVEPPGVHNFDAIGRF